MRITKIGLSDVRRHERLEITPAAGMTVVRGPNEAGKSTIHEALGLALYRKADSNREDVRDIQRWGAAKPATVSLEFEADGRSCRLVKRFAGPRGEAELSLDGEAIRDHALIAEHVATITGIPTEAFFRATASVGHARLSELAGADEPAISDRLQKAVSGADRGTAKARRKLDAAVHRYRTEGQKNPGLLKVVREEVRGLEAELATGEQALERLEADRAQFAEAHDRRLALEAQLGHQQADLDEARRAESLDIQREEAQARYTSSKRAAELVAEADRLGAELPTLMALPALRSSVNRVSSLRFELSEVEADLEVAEEVSEVRVAEVAEVRPSRPAIWLGIGIVLLVAAGLAWLLLGGIPGAAAGLVLGLVGVGLLVQAGRLALRSRDAGLVVELAASAAARRVEADRDQQERFRRRRRELATELERLGVPDVDAAEALLATVETQTDRLSHIEGELRGLGVTERNVRRLEEARDEAANQADEARHALGGMGAPSGDLAVARQAAERLVAQSTPAHAKARSDEDQAQGRVDANLVDAELVATLAERLAAARLREAELLRRVTIYEATKQAIEVAELATLKTAARYLEEHMGPVVSRITDGRYHEIKVDEKTLAFKVRAPESGVLTAVEQLSQGTSDQLFLAARLGLVRLVTMDRRPPLILDDPFVTFDAERAERALRLLKEVATEQGFQVILLTCSERFDALADELVVLEAPSVVPMAPVAPVRAAPVSPIPWDEEEEEAAPAAARPAFAVAPEGPPGADPETGIVDPFRLGGAR